MVQGHVPLGGQSDGEVGLEASWRARLEALLEDRAFQERLRRVATRLLGGSQDAEDVVHDVWVKVLRRPPPGLGGDDEARAYLTTVVEGTARNERRKKLRSAGWLNEVGEQEERKGWDQRDLAVGEEVLGDLVPLLEKLAASKAKTRSRRRLYQQVLGLLHRHALISTATYDRVRFFRPNLRVRTRTTTSVAPGRAKAV